MVEEIESHILKRYELLNKQGKGAYGVVYKAIDKKTHEIVALKKCFDAFQNATDSQRTYREIMLLQELNGHENIISFRIYGDRSSYSNKSKYIRANT